MAQNKNVTNVAMVITWPYAFKCILLVLTQWFSSQNTEVE